MSLLSKILGFDPEDSAHRYSDDHYFPKLRSDVWKAYIEAGSEDHSARNQADMLLSLYTVFFGYHPEFRPSQLHRYVEALMHICIYMAKERFPAPIVEELVDLADALGELEKGQARPFLIPQRGSGHPSDPRNIAWCQMMIASALDYLVSEYNDKVEAASKHLAKNYAPLAAVLTKNSFDGAIRYWRRQLKKKLFREAEAQAAFDRRRELYDAYVASGFEGRMVADKIMADCMLRATRISDEAMKNLYLEVVRRAKANRPY